MIIGALAQFVRVLLPGLSAVFLKSFSSRLLMNSLTFVVVSQLTLAVAQRLDLPEEPFPCNGKYCPRWGYYVCITEDGNSNCLPCDHDQLRGHCGTKLELHGCNLYCQGLALQDLLENLTAMSQKLQEAEKSLYVTSEIRQEIQQNLTITSSILLNVETKATRLNLTIKELQENLSTNIAELNQEKLSIVSLKSDLKNRNNTILALGIFLAILILLLVIFVIKSLMKSEDNLERCCQRDRSTTPLVFKDGKQDNQLNLNVCTYPFMRDQTEKHELENETEDKTNSSDQSCDGDGCYGREKLTNIPPTNTDNKYKTCAVYC